MPVPWNQGEHVTVIGDTGTGKTYLIARLIQQREYVIFFKTKADDTALPTDFRRAKKAAILDGTARRIILQPDYRQQAREGWYMFEKVWTQGGWTLVIDELWYTERLGLTDQVERILTQARSKYVSMVLGMQRPVTTSRFAISQCKHLFTFALEGRDAKTVAEATTPRILPYLQALTGHDFVYFHRASKTILIGNANDLGKIIVQKPLDRERVG